MNMLSDFELHQRDEAFDRADAKSGRVPHADRVRFADAMMAAPCVCTPIRCDMECAACGGPSAKTPCKAELVCDARDGTGRVAIEDCGNSIEATCGECQVVGV